MACGFLVTIDTEGDNLWGMPQEVATENARHLGRFQHFCEHHGMKPVYFVNYEMTNNQIFQSLAEKALSADHCEIGMHLHAWNSPPEYRLTGEDHRVQPFLIDYPESVMEEKIAAMTTLLRERFGNQVNSHRAGRWAMNEVYMKLLEKYKYRVDSSILPGKVIRSAGDEPFSSRSVQYASCPGTPYHPSESQICAAGSMNILEVPVTLRVRRRLFRRPEEVWIRPGYTGLERMKQELNLLVEAKAPYAMLVLHSSELMAGGSPTFETDQDIDALYGEMEELFNHARSLGMCEMTMKDLAKGCSGLQEL